jgi:uncharacterized membrane protein YhiD involved in acid resistance
MEEKPAGFRTNMIIAGSAALLASLGRVVIIDFNQLYPTTLQIHSRWAQ